MPLVNMQSVLTADSVLDRLALRLPQMRHVIRADEPIGGLGLDSIDLVELLCVIENEFDVTISDADLASATTVGELSDVIRRRFEERKLQS